MKRRVKRVYKKLPPHTYEAHPVASAGEASKPLIIGIITIVAIIILSLFLLFSKQLAVGKAIAFFAEEPYSAGAKLTPEPVYENQKFSLKVQANTVEKETNFVSFTLQLPGDMDCSNVLNIQSLGWEVEFEKKCITVGVEQQIFFAYATTGAGKKGIIDVAQIDFTELPIADSYPFLFKSFQALDKDSNNIIQKELVGDPWVEVLTLPSCGDFNIDPGEQCDDGSVVNGDGCSASCQKEFCGDGVTQAGLGEQCDGSDLSGATCMSINQGFIGGTLACSADCKSYDPAACMKQEVQLQCANPPLGLVSKWSGEFNAKNDFVESVDGVPKGSVTFPEGKVGQAFSLNGVDAYVEIPDDASQTPASITVAAWINPQNLLAPNTIVSKYNSALNQRSWSFSTNGDELRFLVLGPNGITEGSEIDTNNLNLAPDQWYYVVATFDSVNKAMKLYINGKEEDSTLTAMTTFTAPADSTASMLIGAYTGMEGPAQLFNGLVDEVSLWNRALTAAEIKSIYDAGSAGICKQQVCTPKQYECESATARKQCKADGTGYIYAKDYPAMYCTEGQTCSNGICAASQLQCATPPSGLAAKWSGENNVQDSTGKNPEGLLKGGATYAAGKVSQAFSFNGVDAYVEIPDDPSLTPASFTLAAWIKPETTTDNIIVRKQKLEEQESWNLQIVSNGKLGLRIAGAGGVSELVSKDVVFSPGTWYHVAATYDPNAKSMKLYVDGQEVPSEPSPNAPISPPYDNPSPVLIGTALLPNPLSQFKGLIDEVSLWNRALTAAEIKSIYDAGSAGMCTVQPQQVCKSNQYECESATARKQCKADGSGYNAKVDCASGETCSNGACVMQPQQVCTANQKVCEGATAYKQCKADGSGYNAKVDCASGETCSNGVCSAQQQQFQCTGTMPANSMLCSGDNTDLAQNTPVKAVSQCGMVKCEYQCDANYKPNVQGTNCESALQPPPPPPPPADCGNGIIENTEQCDDGNLVDGDGCSSACMTEQVVPLATSTGKKITLTDVAPANNVFSTKIKATETFTNEVTVYTILYGPTDKVLSIKSEKLETGLAKDATYTATVNYPEANVKKKSVIVYDVKQNPSVFGQLQVQKQ